MFITIIDFLNSIMDINYIFYLLKLSNLGIYSI